MLARFRNRRFQRVRSHGGPSRPQRTSSSDVGRNPASSSKAGGRNFEKEAIGGDGIGPPPPYKMYASGSCSTSSSLDSSPASPVYPRKEHWRIHLAAIIFLIIAAQAVALAFCDFSSIINGYKKAEDELRKWKTQEPGSVPQGAFWDGLWPSLDCRAYGTREYWGVLHNIPKNWTDVDACMNMPFQIKNLTLRRPYRCAYTEGSPHIHGYWMVDWDQPDCKPWHQDFHDTGCTNKGSGMRRIEAQIVGIPDGKELDWRILCGTTPMTWNHITYNIPTHCDERRFGRKVAMWDIPDESC